MAKWCVLARPFSCGLPSPRVIIARKRMCFCAVLILLEPLVAFLQRLSVFSTKSLRTLFKGLPETHVKGERLGDSGEELDEVDEEEEVGL